MNFRFTTSGPARGWLRISPILVLLASAAMASCGSPQPANTGRDGYAPVYGASDRRLTDPRGTTRGDFQWAASAPTLTEAGSRWEAFLEEHDPAEREFEDSQHASYVAAAQYELLRVYYLQGRRDDGDALLRQLDPVGWMK